MYLETKRIIVRDFTLEDTNDLHDILGDTETMKNCEPAYSLKKTDAFIREFCIGKDGAVAAVHKKTQKVIGYILFNETERDVYEIGWIFNKQYWCNGYAYESSHAVMKYAFSELNAHKTFAEAIDGIKSVGLMKKLGMVLEGIQREQTRDHSGNWADVYFYGAVQNEWRTN